MLYCKSDLRQTNATKSCRCSCFGTNTSLCCTLEAIATGGTIRYGDASLVGRKFCKKLCSDEIKILCCARFSARAIDFKFLPPHANNRVWDSPARCCSSLDGRQSLRSLGFPPSFFTGRVSSPYASEMSGLSPQSGPKRTSIRSPSPSCEVFGLFHPGLASASASCHHVIEIVGVQPRGWSEPR